MGRQPRRNYSPAFKAKVAIEALGDGKTVAEIVPQHDIHPNQVTEWRRQLMERAAGVFGAPTAPETPPVDRKELRAKFGQLTLENDDLQGALIGLMQINSLHLGALARHGITKFELCEPRTNLPYKHSGAGHASGPIR